MSLQLNSGIVPRSALQGNGLWLVHGGAGPQDPRGDRAIRAFDALDQLLEHLLDTNHLDHHPSALTQATATVVHAVHLLEDDPHFNAGYGSALQGDGAIRVSASFMESTKEKFSAVVNAASLRHPVFLAHHLQEARFCVLDGLAADKLAGELGMKREDLVIPERYERWRELIKMTQERQSLTADGTGTVGCVALDTSGHLAAATSTGGVGNETPGRIGDSPTVAGNYCTKNVAISCTGYGEQIINDAFAARVAVRVTDGMSLEMALQRSLEESKSKSHGLAAIAIAQTADQIHWAAGTTETYFIWGACLPDGKRLGRITA
ncbi:MAG: isoaspartyl peptidase/L-asparaginase [Acidobacteria bacterium]|nr:isoaspartyl peptidase/L-asparaginase [Acidobacteriota bacterium]